MDSSRTLPADLNRELLDDLLAAKGLFAALTRIAGEGVVQLDEHGNVVRFSRGAETILGYSAESALGNAFETFFYEEGPGLDLPRSGEDRALELVLRDSADKPVSVRARCAPLQRGDAADGWLVVFSPKARVEEIEQLKNELVSTVSHELKTPLAAIKAYAATLRENPSLYESRREEFLRVVEQQADRLSRLVEDMLLVTRVESEQMLRRRMNVSLDGLIDQALRELTYDPVRHPVQRRGTEIEISGDPDRLRDLLRNLLENAFKYSPDGGRITISAEASERQSILEIRDCGIGIDAADLPYIFDRFYRAQAATTAEAGGSGLGLYIVHALVRAHGGTIDVRSEPGAGTTFTLRLPLR